MKATVWKSPNTVQVEEVPDPKILNRQDAIVKITSTAICGSDLHLLQAYVPAMVPGDILGHEFMGEVVEVGPDVKTLAVGDRVVVPFPIACGVCLACQNGLFSVCENSNPNGWMAAALFGHPIAGVFGYSHLTGGYAGGQAEYARVPFADVGPLKVPAGMTDEQVLFLSDILPTGYMGAEMCDIQPGDTIAVWGCGPVGQFAMASARLLGAERVIGIDRFPYRLEMARDKVGAETINYEEVDVLDALKEMTGGRGPDACIDAVGTEAHGHGPMYLYDRVDARGASRERPSRRVARGDQGLSQRRHRLRHRGLRRLHRPLPDGGGDEPLADDQVRAVPCPALHEAVAGADPERGDRPHLHHHAPAALGAGGPWLPHLQEQARQLRKGRAPRRRSRDPFLDARGRDRPQSAASDGTPSAGRRNSPV